MQIESKLASAFIQSSARIAFAALISVVSAWPLILPLFTEDSTGLGDKDEAFRWLERAYTEHDSWLALLKVWPPFDPLRSDPRFEKLLQGMHFPDAPSTSQ